MIIVSSVAPARVGTRNNAMLSAMFMSEVCIFFTSLLVFHMLILFLITRRSGVSIDRCSSMLNSLSHVIWNFLGGRFETTDGDTAVER